jgi:4a-hydroxytetrahydrobiopterin dehydratase
MKNLTQEKCEVCRIGAPKVTEQEIEVLRLLVPGWLVVDRHGVTTLEKVFQFEDFAAALAFTNSVGALAEEEGHHPALLTEWGRVTVSWWTHKIQGLHRNDFVMAAKTDRLCSRAVFSADGDQS